MDFSGLDDIEFEIKLPFDKLYAGVDALLAGVAKVSGGLTKMGSAGRTAYGRVASATTNAIKKSSEYIKKQRESFQKFGEGGGEAFGKLAAGAAIALGAITLLATSTEGKGKKAFDDLKKSGDDLLFGFQTLVSESGAVSSIFQGLSGEAKHLQKDLANNNEEIQHKFVDATISAAKFANDLSGVVGFLARAARGAVGAFKVAGQGIAVLGLAAVTAYQGIKTLIFEGLSKAAEGLGDFAEGAASLAEKMGQDGLAASLRDGAASLTAFGAEADKDAKGALKDYEMAALAMGNGVSELGDVLVEEAQAAQDFGDAVEKSWDRTTKSIVKNAEVAKKAIKDQSKTMLAGRPKKGGDPQAAARLELIELERRIIEAQRTQNVELEIQLKFQKALLEAEIARKEEKDKSLGKAREALAIDQALLEVDSKRKEQNKKSQEIANQDGLNQLKLKELEATQRKNDLLTAQYQKQQAILEAQNAFAQSEKTLADFSALKVASLQAQMEYEAALGEIQAAKAEAEVAQLERMGEGLDAALAALEGGGSPILATFAAMGGQLDELAIKYRELEAAGVSANAALAGAAAQGAGAMGAAVASQIKDQRKAAAVQGAFAAAQAILFYAQGNIPSAIGATAASVAHFAVAGGAGAGKGSGAVAASRGGGGGGSASPSAGVAPPGAGGGGQDQAAKRSAQYIAEALSQQGRGGREVVINFNMSNAVLLEDSLALSKRLTSVMRDQLERERL